MGRVGVCSACYPILQMYYVQFVAKSFYFYFEFWQL